MTSRLHVLLVDDHEVVRKGLRLLLETVLDYEVSEASGGIEALERIEQALPDVVLLDVRMSDYSGIWTLQQIRERFGNLPVLMLSTFDTAEYVDDAIEFGAAGYLLKDASSQQLAEAIATARTGGGLYLHPQVARRLLARKRTGTGPQRLSDRESHVLVGLVAGQSTNDIAADLHVSPKTVKSHLTSIYRKLGVANRTQAVSKALRDRLVEHASE